MTDFFVKKINFEATLVITQPLIFTSSTQTDGGKGRVAQSCSEDYKYPEKHGSPAKIVGLIKPYFHLISQTKPPQ